MKRNYRDWFVIAVGGFLACITYGLYKMYAVVYGPPPATYDPPQTLQVDSMSSVNDSIRRTVSDGDY